MGAITGHRIHRNGVGGVLMGVAHTQQIRPNYPPTPPPRVICMIFSSTSPDGKWQDSPGNKTTHLQRGQRKGVNFTIK